MISTDRARQPWVEPGNDERRNAIQVERHMV